MSKDQHLHPSWISRVYDAFYAEKDWCEQGQRQQLEVQIDMHKVGGEDEKTKRYIKTEKSPFISSKNPTWIQTFIESC